jgi:hypothetical protein
MKEHGCVDCLRAFATQKDLRRHMECVHDKTGKGWTCPVLACGKNRIGHVYNRKDNFSRHMKKHPGLEPDFEREGGNSWFPEE